MDILSLQMNGALLTPVESTSCLGVPVDQQFIWNEHIDHISTKLARHVGILAGTS